MTKYIPVILTYIAVAFIIMGLYDLIFDGDFYSFLGNVGIAIAIFVIAVIVQWRWVK